jgi:uncharacterized membrane protein
MGLAVPFSGLVLEGLMTAATPEEKAVLARMPPRMSRIGDIGLTLLWVTGIALVFHKWGGFGVLPWQFHAKLTAVVLLTLAVGFIHAHARRAAQGDATAMRRMRAASRFAFLMALTAAVFAVLTFD